jgi:hypothetical protein
MPQDFHRPPTGPRHTKSTRPGAQRLAQAPNLASWPAIGAPLAALAATMPGTDVTRPRGNEEPRRQKPRPDVRSKRTFKNPNFRFVESPKSKNGMLASAPTDRRLRPPSKTYPSGAAAGGTLGGPQGPGYGAA